MSGGARGVSGQQLDASQSTGVGQPALKENPTLASCGSTPEGGSESSALVTSVREYGEKSPVALRLIVTVKGSAAVGAWTLVMVGVVSPVSCILAAVRPRLPGGFRKVSASCVPHPAMPITSR